jgi:hypothetical protein
MLLKLISILSFIFAMQTAQPKGLIVTPQFVQSPSMQSLVKSRMEDIIENYFSLLTALRKIDYDEQNLPQSVRNFLESLSSLYYYCLDKKSSDEKCLTALQNFEKGLFELDIAMMRYHNSTTVSPTFDPNLIYYRHFFVLSLNLMYLQQKTLSLLYIMPPESQRTSAAVIYFEALKLKSTFKAFYQGLVQFEQTQFIDYFWDDIVDYSLSLIVPEMNPEHFVQNIEKTNININHLSYTCERLKKELNNKAMDACEVLHRNWNSILKLVLKN